tara:strand:- start:341 stop:598 length:258 start_codon:yes stop_codon:yes gene_type:complete
MPCSCSTWKMTKCDHCGFPRYGYNKYDYYQLAIDYYISSKLTLTEITQKFNLKYSRLMKCWLLNKHYYGYGNLKRKRLSVREKWK